VTKITFLVLRLVTICHEEIVTENIATPESLRHTLPPPANCTEYVQLDLE
jgi:hypothetical protein